MWPPARLPGLCRAAYGEAGTRRLGVSADGREVGNLPPFSSHRVSFLPRSRQGSVLEGGVQIELHTSLHPPVPHYRTIERMNGCLDPPF
mmetsp:Transcript_5831/g.13793  ORF Transcript_5831/g.13793 Transcript_5831/m.13793 type:complete len:89 (-) Transcript_5831:373-639(-)